MNDLISIVVPIYNVENYLENCIISLINQTYKELEIILVDDGSSDNSGLIADSFFKIDKRIKVIHKKNGGLSDARNVGIENSNGKFITFVDSDDYLPNDAIDYLYKSLIDNDVDISVGRLKTTNSLSNVNSQHEKIYEIYDKCQGLNQLLYANKYSVAAPGKMYLKSLFDGIRFPKGKLHEDVFTTYKIFLKANRVYYGDKIVYYYYHRPGSITISNFSARRLDIIEALEQIKKDIPLEKYGCLNGYASQCVEDMFMLLGLKPNKQIIDEYDIWHRIKQYRSIILFDKECSKRVRCYAFLSYTGCFISSNIFCLYQKIKWKA